jgi:hypothetical protein
LRIVLSRPAKSVLSPSWKRYRLGGYAKGMATDHRSTLADYATKLAEVKEYL